LNSKLCIPFWTAFLYMADLTVVYWWNLTSLWH